MINDRLISFVRLSGGSRLPCTHMWPARQTQAVGNLLVHTKSPLPQGAARRELANLQQRFEHVEAEYKDAAAAAEQLQQANAQVRDYIILSYPE